MSSREVVPLTALAPNEVGVIAYLAGGRGIISRLAALGFTPGTELTMVQNFGRGPIIVNVLHSRIALGRGEAQKVMVRRR